MTSAAIYARVSSARRAKDETIGSQTAALRAHAEQQGLEVPGDWVFIADGHSGATLGRPALEASRDLIARIPKERPARPLRSRRRTHHRASNVRVWSAAMAGLSSCAASRPWSRPARCCA